MNPTEHAPPRLLLLGAPDRASLLGRIDRATQRLASGISPLQDELGQPDEQERLAIVGPAQELVALLAVAREKLAEPGRTRLSMRNRGIYFGQGQQASGVAFLYPGEGAQRVGMMDTARQHLSPLREWLSALDQTFLGHGHPPPSELIYPPSGSNADESALFDIARGGPLSTAISLALHEVLVGYGVRPDALLGHSNGEHAAVMAACLDLSRDRQHICDWLHQTSRAGLALHPPEPAQGMLAVSAFSSTALTALLAEREGEVFLAMDNCSLQQVLGGHRAELEKVAEHISAQGGIGLKLPFQRAYHTPLFARWGETLAAHYPLLALPSPKTPVYSCLTGQAMGPEADAMRETMARQWTATISLRNAVENLYAKGIHTFIEVGPDNKLCAFVDDTLRGRPHLAAGMASARQDDMAVLKTLLAQLYAHGVGLDVHGIRLREFPAPPPVARPLTSPPQRQGLIERQAALITDAKARMQAMQQSFLSRRGTGSAHPATKPGTAVTAAFSGGALARELRRQLSTTAMPWLADHSLGRGQPALPVLAFTTSLALAAAVARQTVGAHRSAPVVLTAVKAQRWLALDEGKLGLHIAWSRQANTVDISLRDEQPLHDEPAFSSHVEFIPAAVAPLAPLGEQGSGRCAWTPERFYREYAFHGPQFQCLRQVTWIGSTGIVAELETTLPPAADAELFAADPALLDGAGQLVALWLLEHSIITADTGVFPYQARRVVLHETPPPGVRVRCEGRIAVHGEAVTEADFVFSAGGRIIATIEGFAQRLIALPSILANWIFGDGRMAFSSSTASGERTINLDEWRDTLEANGGIWARALAHRVLNAHELPAWSSHRDVEDLLARIAAKELALEDMARRGMPTPPLHAITISRNLLTYGDYDMSFDYRPGGTPLRVARSKAFS
ncbi:polyketide synthase dehydratase domain-containing protein [Ottowia thiooxydans]|uniref:polyketide synthase dehydratase domain-containing protein n=1 Tax=Ottowia thiooxydans TaxID=219182 RepID=UPI00041551FE|nr:polyketide synthase dehydratase domain-containing protein [Ottowia thiooxydans]